MRWIWCEEALPGSRHESAGMVRWGEQSDHLSSFPPGNEGFREARGGGGTRACSLAGRPPESLSRKRCLESGPGDGFWETGAASEKRPSPARSAGRAAKALLDGDDREGHIAVQVALLGMRAQSLAGTMSTICCKVTRSGRHSTSWRSRLPSQHAGHVEGREGGILALATAVEAVAVRERGRLRRRRQQHAGHGSSGHLAQRAQPAGGGHAPASLPSKAMVGRPWVWNSRLSASPTSCSSVLSLWAASMRSWRFTRGLK